MDGIGARTCAIALALVMLAGCARDPGSAIGIPGGGAAVATIDGEPVPGELLLEAARAYRLDLSAPQGRDEVLRRLTDLVVLAKVAQREDFARDPQFAARVALARLQGVADATVHALESRANIDAGAIRATYERQVSGSGDVAWDFTQLLFTDEDAALLAEGDVLAGKPFREVFDAHRARASQARSFRDVNATQVPAEIAAALRALQPGEATRLPVRTRFGWHVVHLDAVHPFTPPPLEAVEDGIRRSLARRFAETRLAELRDNARVTLDEKAFAALARASPGVAPAADGGHVDLPDDSIERAAAGDARTDPR